MSEIEKDENGFMTCACEPCKYIWFYDWWQCMLENQDATLEDPIFMEKPSRCNFFEARKIKNDDSPC